MPASDVVVKIRFSGGTQPPVILTDPEEPNDPVEPGGTTGITTERIYGDNRIDTAIALSKANFTKADTVVIARADDYPDALTASVLAKAVNGPILLSYPDRVNDKVLAEISRLGARNILLIGGEEAMHASTAQAYAKGRNTERIGGKNRYDTAAVIAKHFHKTAQTAYLATGEDFPDALTAGLIAGKANAPLLLTNKSILRAETVNYLKEAKVEKVIVVGGPEAITEKVVKEIK